MCNCNDLPEVLNGTAQKMITEKEAILRERAAWNNGVSFGAYYGEPGQKTRDIEVAHRYPLPKVKQLREITIGQSKFQYSPYTGLRENWGYGWGIPRVTIEAFYPDDLRKIVDLMQNPWEEVEV